MAKMSGSIDIFATVGTFDGVHRGHLFLLKCLREAAAARGLRPAAIVPVRHPLSVIRPDAVPLQISTFKDKKRLIEQAGVTVIPLDFTKALSRLDSTGFLKLIRDEMGAKGLMTGYDNRFGSDRQHTFHDYVREGDEAGIEVVQAPELKGMSSSRIRQALMQGDLDAAADMLGRRFSLCGTVVPGQRLGSDIGFATANMQTEEPGMAIPARGVYATLAKLTGERSTPWMPAMTNIGYRPTIDKTENRLSIETHIFGIDTKLYGRGLTLQFVSRLREERKFASLSELGCQLAKDALSARNALADSGAYAATATDNTQHKIKI